MARQFCSAYGLPVVVVTPLHPAEAKRLCRKLKKIEKGADPETELRQMRLSLEARAARFVPTTPWAEACASALLRGAGKIIARPVRTKAGKMPVDPIGAELAMRDIFPPAAVGTPMQPCSRRCCRSKLYPALAMAARKCDSCVEGKREQLKEAFDWWHNVHMYDFDDAVVRECRWICGMGEKNLERVEEGDEAGTKRQRDKGTKGEPSPGPAGPGASWSVREIAEKNIDVVQMKLEPATVKALKQEIAEFHATGEMAFSAS